ncbi:unnamed protein product [Peronospora destructor]|uniref:Uncharacterized protein n=1 Tax=Peronospora destructor TaxID=86335 RepID=A0AAV0V9H2_9STRA|nr:unnamed protein product [Peronospora destructor]
MLSNQIQSVRADEIMSRTFVQLDCDKETKAFIDTCTGGSLWESMSSTVLGLFYSLTDANGILGRGQMFVLSYAQVQRLLHRKQLVEVGGGSLLDIGAGDGNVTASLASLVDQRTNLRLAARIRPVTKTLQHYQHAHVLDRADKSPLTMLREIREMLDQRMVSFC